MEHGVTSPIRELPADDRMEKGGASDRIVPRETGRYSHVRFEGVRRSRGRIRVPVDDAVDPATSCLPGDELSEGDEMRFLRAILARSGLRQEAYRMSPLQRRLSACLRALRVETWEQAVDLLESRPSLLGKALDSLLIGTTEFFRDPTVFAALDERVVPELLERVAWPRIWSAACSDGAELLSIAMLLWRRRALAGGELLGTDYRPEAIGRAGRGVFPMSAMSAIPDGYRECWQRRDQDTAIVAEQVRASIRWEIGDVLAGAIPAGSWDMILCRNLAIYLEPLAATRLWERLFAALAPGGVLIVGKAEKPRVAGLQREGRSIFRKPKVKP